MLAMDTNVLVYAADGDSQFPFLEVIDPLRA
jgi:hypothetical protein